MAREVPQLTARYLLLSLNERFGQDSYEIHAAWGTRMSIKKPTSQLSHLAVPGAGIEPVFGDERPYDGKHWWPNIDKVACLP